MSPPAERTFRDVLPSCYRHLLPEFFDRPRPEEPHATCDRCAMVPAPGLAAEGRRFFRPDAKCCTYQPFLPNYSVGGLLSAEETRGSLGRERIRQRIERSEAGVVPAGIRPSAEYMVRYKAAPDFGTRLDLRCPYYDEPGGGCSVWAFREANCTTWFCKLRHGRDGLTFWSSLRSYLHTLEKALTRHCLGELGFSAEAVGQATQLPETAEAASREAGPEGRASRRALWGEWLGREEELYVACYRRVLALRPDEVAHLAGDALGRELDRVAAALGGMLEPGLPEVLRRNPRADAQRVPGGWLVTGYSPYDPIQLGDRVWDALQAFDGVTTTETLRGRDEGLSDELLRRLVQLELLLPADPAPAGAAPQVDGGEGR